MIIIQLFFFLISLCLTTSLCNLNLSKLGAHYLRLNNSIQNSQTIKVLLNKKCELCADKHQKKTNIILTSEQKISIGDKNNRIYEIKTINPHAYKKLHSEEANDNGIKYTLNIQKNQSNDFPVHKEQISFDELNYHTDLINTLKDSLTYGSPDMPWLLSFLPEETTPFRFLNLLNNLYKRNNFSHHLNSLKQCNLFRIPCIIHQTWFGNKMPYLYRQWQKIAKKKHPHWRHICWSEEIIKKRFPEGFFNQLSFNSAKNKKNYAQMSDISRYEIIFKYGGVYLDSDILCFESFDSIHKVYDFYTCVEPVAYVCAAELFGAKSAHPIVRRCLDLVKSYEEKEIPCAYPRNSSGEKKFYDNMLRAGPGLITKSIMQMLKENNQEIQKGMMVFPSIYLMPANNFEKIARYVFPCTFSYHAFYCPEVKHSDHWTL